MNLKNIKIATYNPRKDLQLNDIEYQIKRWKTLTNKEAVLVKG